MFLNRLLSEFPGDMQIFGDINVPIREIQYDSRKVKEGDLFFCIKGAEHDGHDYIKIVEKMGAAAVVVEELPEKFISIPAIKVSNTREAMSILSDLFFHRPSSRFDLVGVSGTNGKTTVCYLMESIYKEADIPAAVMGTVNYRFKNIVLEADKTTPESPDSNRFLFSAADMGAKAAIMEVSSHAIELSRVKGLRFATAIFTNITPEHLDFHDTFESYRNVKKSFFAQLNGHSKVVINIDDEAGRSIVRESRSTVITYGLSEKAQVRAEELSIALNGLHFKIITPDGSIKVSAHITGEHNIYNILAATAALWANGISLKTIKKGIGALKNIPGRFEKVPTKKGFNVFVDYAHTSDALEKLLSFAKKMNHGRLITVFGCGGNRDRQKRPNMGKTAAELSDYVVLTSDNPRYEDPMDIIGEILTGVKSVEKSSFKVIPDRREAIFHAVGKAKRGDIVLIAGKGHETVQIEGKESRHFSDIEVVKEAILN